MAKKKILYPIVKETTYYDDSEWNTNRGVAGTPDRVKDSLISYDGFLGDNVELVENRVFKEVLTYDGYGRGRSSAVFYFKDSTGATYQMFMTDMDDLLKHKSIMDQKISGEWTYQKRGKNFGIRLADSELKK
ncbi:hypothetical protein [Oceanobacillus kimchii]|uniref:Uncharacterized protein n=1 Tax=Oceanobacillus kimchii TaxID=746691 RepID=A0ABQ5TH80_9BACI|nr:hypothetical protein [Oceanobacillus kimchii]GLO66231.1 hypothetical protein MACH08_20150 [Oceanobacillus kimchii]